MEFTGDFETHITVHCPQEMNVESLRAWGESRGLKFHHIVLDRGQFTSQPMLTRVGNGRLSGELMAATEIVNELTSAGFAVSRIKVEAAPWNDGVPRTSAETASQSDDQYFEHHIKLLLLAHANVSALVALAQGHAAHLSRNSRRIRDDGLHERFITQRCQGVGRVESRARLDALLDQIHSAGHQILEVEEEYVVYDTNLELDAGWISTGP